jgi:hypothetical protein
MDELHIENCKVILCNPPDSRSALIQPLDFLYNEGEGLKNNRRFILKDYFFFVCRCYLT